MHSRLITEPAYQQLSALLREMITRREFAPGQRFLTERQICERFGVSRATANKALANLVVSGILVFRKGVGTFVREGVLDYDLGRLVSFTDKALAAGMKPSTRVLTFQTIEAASIPGEVRTKLSLGLADEVYWIERLRLADEMPVILERRHVVAKHCPGLTWDDLSQSLYRVWTDKYHLDIAGADQTIRAVSIGSIDCRLLDVPAGSPGLRVESVGFLKGDIPLWFEKTLYRGDRYEFQNRLGPIAPLPARGAFIEGTPD